MKIIAICHIILLTSIFTLSFYLFAHTNLTRNADFIIYLTSTVLMMFSSGYLLKRKSTHVSMGNLLTMYLLILSCSYFAIAIIKDRWVSGMDKEKQEVISDIYMMKDLEKTFVDLNYSKVERIVNTYDSIEKEDVYFKIMYRIFHAIKSIIIYMLISFIPALIYKKA